MSLKDYISMTYQLIRELCKIGDIRISNRLKIYYYETATICRLADHQSCLQQAGENEINLIMACSQPE
jgi:hypothetical protein